MGVEGRTQPFLCLEVAWRGEGMAVEGWRWGRSQRQEGWGRTQTLPQPGHRLEAGSPHFPVGWGSGCSLPWGVGVGHEKAVIWHSFCHKYVA